MESETLRQIFYAIAPMILENIESQIEELNKSDMYKYMNVIEKEHVFVVKWSERDVMDGHYSIVIKK